MSEAAAIPVATFGSKILCTAHNSALSPLDACGTKFFNAVHFSGLRFRTGELPPVNGAAVNGFDVERWLLKMLIGSACGVFAETKKRWLPPLWWLRVLFGKRALGRRNGGLLLGHSIGVFSADVRLGTQPIWRDSLPVGLTTKLGGLDFTLLMENPLKVTARTHRPGVLRTVELGGEREDLVILGWDQHQKLITVDLEWAESKDTFPPTAESQGTSIV